MRSEQITIPIFSSVVQGLDILQRVYMRAVSYVSPNRVSRTAFGVLMACNSRDFVQRRIRFFGVFEHNLSYLTARRLRAGDLYVDIGANVGYFTTLAAKIVGPAGRVISVEADPRTYDQLKENIRLNRFENVTAHNVAATAERCEVSIRQGEAHNAGSNSVVIGGYGLTVPGLPLREILGEDLGRVRFIKIDIEGSEAPVLEAILDDLDEFPRDLIVASEVSEGSAGFVARFVTAGFRAYGLHNPYTIDYYLVRTFLARFGEAGVVAMKPVTAFDPAYTDYVFERM
ncbi:MAG: FkbM family methyltransferase [Actinomycetospora chiangmaiensis]|jgi:FkbM family methyltransferase|nr:FkbM family methyltransferase [Actinomycetospora chiangmaiensis]